MLTISIVFAYQINLHKNVIKLHNEQQRQKESSEDLCERISSFNTILILRNSLSRHNAHYECDLKWKFLENRKVFFNCQWQMQ
jgi:hypothetical protein